MCNTGRSTTRRCLESLVHQRILLLSTLLHVASHLPPEDHLPGVTKWELCAAVIHVTLQLVRHRGEQFATACMQFAPICIWCTASRANKLT